MTCRVQRPIVSDCLRYVTRMKEIIKSLPKELVTCSECGDEANIHEGEVSPNQGSGLPFAKATLVGCDSTIDKVFEGILREGARQEIALNDCFEGMKS